MLDEGWLAFDAIKLTSLSAPIAVRPGQDHTLAVQINGQLEGANAARLFIRYSDGTIVNVWQNESGFTGSQNVSGDFITPAGAASFQVGTEVMLDQGYLSWTNVTLTAYSAAFSVTAGHTYQFTGQVTGTLAASLGQGGRITAVYNNGETLLWQNPANFNGTTTVQQTFTGNDEGAPTRLALTANLDAGHLAFGDVDLQYLADGDFIRRSTYTLAGQAVAVRVSGDPEGNDGLYYLYSDHASTLLSTGLGSTTAMTDPNGSLVGEVVRYYPFGGYRTAPTARQSAISDRGFTGHKSGENGGSNDIGLIYMNARYFAPGLGRFVSADTLVPDPANPQSLNRYSYVRNNPVNLTDPTGHWDCVQDQNYDACRESVQTWLSTLWNDGDDIAKGIYLWFQAEDAHWMIRNGTGILFEFKNINFGAQVPPCGGATGLCDLVRDPKIEININNLGRINSDNDRREMAALLAHEVVHLQQGDMLAWSVLGEADAYLTQEILRGEFDLTPSGSRTRLGTISQLMGGGLTMTELRQFQGVLNYSGTPLMPLTPLRFMWSLSASSEPFIQASVDTFRGIYGDYVSLISGVKSSPTPLIPATSPQPH